MLTGFYQKSISKGKQYSDHTKEEPYNDEANKLEQNVSPLAKCKQKVHKTSLMRLIIASSTVTAWNRTNYEKEGGRR